ncbi:DUF6249 domain-containing protein [Dyadobacter sp. NIV53]|uniref:DUF6249 domain-containing protein n=1 Tax=Dyadobacter sp. NIV53 TaxID=2861765 RepID=UPI001C880134|nr:DUF6249 domain-containing protein [Dyadobacter sp. NIV53]
MSGLDDFKHIIISVASIAAIFGILYVFLMTRYKERMAMIEKNVGASLFVSKDNGVSPTLKFGMLFVGIALGILMASVAHTYTDLSMGIALLSMIFLFGGTSLILNFIIERKLGKKE